MTPLDADTIELLASEFGVDSRNQEAAKRGRAAAGKLADAVPDDPALLEPRPPVITFLGHVDHGKTSLLDKIIGIDVASGESGGITQHIRAYQIERDGRKISFVDTPGHEAFTEMRARGANVTDIAVLVVAADDGVMPQTEEAISHARAAGVPIVIALNKIDLPGVNYDRIYSQLSDGRIAADRMGRRHGIGQMQRTDRRRHRRFAGNAAVRRRDKQLKANPNRTAVGTCLEAELHEGRGVVAKLIVQNGTLRVGDAMVCGTACGRVKAMYDTLNPRRKLDAAGPSTPVNVTGLDVAPAPATTSTCWTILARRGKSPSSGTSKTRLATLGHRRAGARDVGKLVRATWQRKQCKR